LCLPKPPMGNNLSRRQYFSRSASEVCIVILISFYFDSRQGRLFSEEKVNAK
jgi:hypothetical protein